MLILIGEEELETDIENLIDATDFMIRDSELDDTNKVLFSTSFIRIKKLLKRMLEIVQQE